MPDADRLAARSLPGDGAGGRRLVPFRSIGALLDERAAASPGQVFLIYCDDDAGARTVHTLGAFARRVGQVANRLRRLGVRRGDRVATLAHNHPDVALIYFACWKLGATATPQNLSEDDRHIAFIMQNAGCRIALVQPWCADRLERLRAGVPGLGATEVLDAAWQRALDAEPEAFAGEDALPQDECLLVYTSGTTGAPKGVQLSQYNLLVNVLGMMNWQRLTPDDRFMCVLPIHHVNGIMVTLLMPLYAGSSVVLNRGFKAATFWRRLAEERVAVVSVVPTLLQFLCEADEDVSALDLSRLRRVMVGAGTLTVALALRFERRFNVPLLHGYGLSETTAYACQLPVDLDAEAHRHWLEDFGYPSIGIPLEPNEMTILDPEGHPLPPGERGEICIRGHTIMIGYFARPDANREAFRHGWFHSGDEGFLQQDGEGRRFFFITGRIKELINRGGVKYSPFEIEEVLLELSGVKVGLAIAFENDWYGEEVGAYVVRAEGSSLSEDAILAHCRSRMPFAKAPKVVVFGADAPVTATGKYQRLQLKPLFAAYRATQFRAADGGTAASTRGDSN